MQELSFYNGTFITTADPQVGLEDRGYQFGDGVYEVTHFYGDKPFALDLHLDRLQRSLGEIRIGDPYSRAEWEALHRQLVEKSGIRDAAVYLQVTRGTAPRSHAFPDKATPNVSMTIRPSEPNLQQQAEGVKAIFVEDIRWLRCDIKSLNLLGNVLAKQAAHEGGAVEAIQYRREGNFITEGSSSNFFAVKKGALWTHPVSHLILKGITRTVLLEQCAPQLGLDVIERPFSPEFALTADEAFITSTSLEVTPVTAIDGHPIGSGRPGPVAQKLLAAFRELTGSRP